ncbi:MAG TPA: ATP-binding protein [Candidatus Limnocylindrales bacterium]|nr:ATP-binding protein [Candidatus Limnocylindrales bacterium]
MSKMSLVGSKILVLDEDPNTWRILKKILIPKGCTILPSNSYEEGKKYLTQFSMDLILIEISLGEGKGLLFAEELRKNHPYLPIIILTSEISLQAIKKAIKLGVSDYILKPPDPMELLDSIREAISRYKQTLLDQAILKNSRQYFEELITLMEVSKITNSFEHIDLLLQRVVEIVSQILDVETVSLMGIQEDTQELAVLAYIGPEKQIVENARVPIGTGISGWVAQQGKPLLINNIEKSEKFKKFRKKTLDQYKNDSLLCVPLKIKDRVIGVLNVNNKKSGKAFDLHDLDLLRGISNPIALAIENAWLYEKLQIKARELERLNKELQQLDQMKSNFISNISHEIRTPLTSINGYAELLLEMGNKLSPEKGKEFLQAILESGKQISILLDQIAEFSLVESDKVKWNIRPVLLHPLITRIIDRFQTHLEKKQITLTYQPSDRSLQVYADEEKIDRVLCHFMDNAIKFNKEKGKIDIKMEEVQRKECHPFVKVSITDTGIGISKENTSYLFTKFNQLGNILTEKPPGVGLGLAFCKEIISRHRGEIGVESEPKKGSTFYFTLPLVTEGKESYIVRS